MRDDLSTMIVHDLRNPIGNILFACVLLLQKEVDEKQKQKIQKKLKFWGNSRLL